MPYKDPQCAAACRARYEASPKGKANRARYKASPKGKASKARYKASPKGKACDARYNASPKGKANEARNSYTRLFTRNRRFNPTASLAPQALSALEMWNRCTGGFLTEFWPSLTLEVK